jgi:AcrR family transcriptional regulator
VATGGGRAYRGQSAEARVAERRQRIMDAALDVFAAKGWAQAGVKEICAAAGLTDRYLYESWKNTSELFLEVHGAAADRLFTAVLDATGGLDPDAGPLESARAFVGAFVRELEADRRLGHMLFVDPGPQDLAPERGELVRQKMLRWAQLMEHVATGLLGQTAANPSKLRFWSLSTVGAFRTTTVEWLAGGLPMSTEEIIDALVSMMLEGAARLVPSAEPS